jgi:hypothetical protein
MVRSPITFHHALKILNVTAKGGATVLLSTISSCYLAVVVEKTAHRIQYYYFPHWYKDVDFALGLNLHQNNNNGRNRKIDNNSEKINHDREEMFIINNSTINYHDWIDKSDQSYDRDREELFSLQDKFETQTTTIEKSPPSRMSSLFQTLTNGSTESMSTTLQNCAMTA